MNCVDFDKHFQNYLRQWTQQNMGRFKNVDEMEAEVPEVYLRWLNEPCDWLSGRTPGDYFEQFDDAKFLCKWLSDYVKKKVPVPDQLMERITALGEESVPELIAIAGRKEAGNEVRMTAIGLLREMECEQPMEMYISWLGSGEFDELCENAAESLKNMGGKVIEPLLQAYETANAAARECIADILCDYPTEKRVLPLLLELMDSSSNTALIASYIAKFGDPDALPRMKQALEDPAINYLDYVEIANAVRALGGEVTSERTFDGDPYYESMKKLG